jgi:hypothetical protein
MAISDKQASKMVVAMHGQGMEDAGGAPMSATANYKQRPGKKMIVCYGPMTIGKDETPLFEGR